ncbi:MAG: hypothetical protein ACE366_05660 [Bradymonadia bacterium]
MSTDNPTRVIETNGRITVERIKDGEIESWLELPASLKQPFMAMVAEVANGVKSKVDYPVPGGDAIVVSRTDFDGMSYGLRVTREPVGFPSEGRDVMIDAKDIPLFLCQARGV